MTTAKVSAIVIQVLSRDISMSQALIRLRTPKQKREFLYAMYSKKTVGGRSRFNKGLFSRTKDIPKGGHRKLNVIPEQHTTKPGRHHDLQTWVSTFKTKHGVYSHHHPLKPLAKDHPAVIAANRSRYNVKQAVSSASTAVSRQHSKNLDSVAKHQRKQPVDWNKTDELTFKPHNAISFEDHHTLHSGLPTKSNYHEAMSTTESKKIARQHSVNLHSGSGGLSIAKPQAGSGSLSVAKQRRSGGLSLTHGQQTSSIAKPAEAVVTRKSRFNKAWVAGMQDAPGHGALANTPEDPQTNKKKMKLRGRYNEPLLENQQKAFAEDGSPSRVRETIAGKEKQIRGSALVRVKNKLVGLAPPSGSAKTYVAEARKKPVVEKKPVGKVRSASDKTLPGAGAKKKPTPLAMRPTSWPKHTGSHSDAMRDVLNWHGVREESHLPSYHYKAPHGDYFVEGDHRVKKYNFEYQPNSRINKPHTTDRKFSSPNEAMRHASLHAESAAHVSKVQALQKSRAPEQQWEKRYTGRKSFSAAIDVLKGYGGSSMSEVELVKEAKSGEKSMQGFTKALNLLKAKKPVPDEEQAHYNLLEKVTEKLEETLGVDIEGDKEHGESKEHKKKVAKKSIFENHQDALLGRNSCLKPPPDADMLAHRFGNTKYDKVDLIKGRKTEAEIEKQRRVLTQSGVRWHDSHLE